jgi:pyruvate/2-oxoglutarate/acetoin dehydrogenase E1 component
MTTLAETDMERRELAYVAALPEAIAQCMEEDPNVFLAGEDVGAYGHVMGTTRGLYERFGPQRIVDTPISEIGIVGLATGAAAAGLRPVVDIMFIDFIGCCMDQIVNQLAKMKYMFGGQARLPVTITTTAGAGGSLAAQHSQSLEAWLCHVPGLKVVMPSNAYDAKGLLIASIRDDDPVVFIQHKFLLGTTCAVPEEPYEVPLGVARIAREGTDITVVATGRMVHEALTAASTLAADGISLEVIDPRTLQPFDLPTVLTSVAKTHRAIVVHEAVRFGGIGAEYASEIAELGFDDLDAPVVRIGAPFSPVPFSPVLEEVYVPTAERIVAEARRLAGRS